MYVPHNLIRRHHMRDIGAAYNRGYRKVKVDDKSTSGPAPSSTLGLIDGSGELFHHMCRLVVVKDDPRVKSLVQRYNGWYATGDCPPKFITVIKDLINSELWADPIEYGDDATIQVFSSNMLSQINYRWKDAPKLMKKENYKWIINKSFTAPYMNLPLMNKYVKGFILWPMVDAILLNPKVDDQPTNVGSSKSAYDTLFPDDSDCVSSNTTSGKRGAVEDFLYNTSFKVSNSARLNLEAIWNGIEDGLSGKKR
jgi:hypothetical protein